MYSLQSTGYRPHNCHNRLVGNRLNTRNRSGDSEHIPRSALRYDVSKRHVRYSAMVDKRFVNSENIYWILESLRLCFNSYHFLSSTELLHMSSFLRVFAQPAFQVFRSASRPIICLRCNEFIFSICGTTRGALIIHNVWTHSLWRTRQAFEISHPICHVICQYFFVKLVLSIRIHRRILSNTADNCVLNLRNMLYTLHHNPWKEIWMIDMKTFKCFVHKFLLILFRWAPCEIKDIDSLTTTFVGIRDAWFERYRENRKKNIKFFD